MFLQAILIPLELDASLPRMGLLTPSYIAEAAFDSGIKIELASKVSIAYDQLTEMLFVRLM